MSTPLVSPEFSPNFTDLFTLVIREAAKPSPVTYPGSELESHYPAPNEDDIRVYVGVEGESSYTVDLPDGGEGDMIAHTWILTKRGPLERYVLMLEGKVMWINPLEDGTEIRSLLSDDEVAALATRIDPYQL